jgi:hypothetical protein
MRNKSPIQGKHRMRKDAYVDHICVLCRGELAIHLSGNLLNSIKVGSLADKLRKLNVVTEDKDQALSSFGPSTFESEIFSGRRAH